ncbi:MAG: mycofactocin system FadH/OYE family oxidoreductase 1 [Acidimicrobiales bacterium]
MTGLGDPVRLGNLTAPNRLVFGPHVTNLGRRRQISDRHVAYYRARAAGGAGVIVVEEASVDASDWPYERAPLAAECAEGWSLVAEACHGEGSLCIAAIGHAGGQGSSAYHQRALLAPSSVPDVVTREVPKAMEAEEVASVVAAFATAARLAVEAGCDGVEVNAGQWSLLRQFCSGLTNLRGDELGSDRAALVRQVVEAVRSVAGRSVVGLRFSCDELAPWAGIVPEAAAPLLSGLVAGDRVDYVTVVRGSAYGTGATWPDGHVAPGFNRETTALVRRALPASVAVFAQGSIVDVDMAAEVLATGEADLVEMTRALIADHAVGRKVAAGEASRIRPCTLCNQACQVRDPRNPLVSCTVDPAAGHETDEPSPPDGKVAEAVGLHLLVVGGGPAGLECARVAALRGFDVTVLEREQHFGGMALTVSRLPGQQRFGRVVEWLEAECRLAGVELVAGHEAALEELDAHDGPVVCCTGSRDGRRNFAVAEFATVIGAGEVLLADRIVGEPVPSPVVVFDPIGGPIGVGAAELLATLGASVTFVTPDFVVGEQLAMSGDLAPANVRLQQAGVELVKRSVVRSVEPEHVVVEHRDSGEIRSVAAAVLVDAGHRLPEDTLYRTVTVARADVAVAGDAVAPRTVLESVLEGRRVAMALAVTRPVADGVSVPR